MSTAPYRVAVVGATGQVGGVLLELLAEREFPVSEIVPFASERSVGRVLGAGLVVQPLEAETIQGFDLALFSAGAGISREWAPRFAAAGAVVVDNSSAFRMDPSVPLVVSEVNPDDLGGHRGIVANPNCSTMQMVVALRPIQLAVGIERLVVTTFQAVSGTGKNAVDTLLDQARRVLAGEDAGDAGPYAHRIAFNALPQAGAFPDGDDHTDEERKLINETKKILGDETIRVSPTCVRVPVVNGHSESVTVETRAPLSAEDARELLRGAPGLVVVDDPAAGGYPMAVDADGADPVYVGRIRSDPGHPQALSLWIVADNLRKGAALNAVQIAEVLHERGLVGARVA
ncbi:MAG: Aspartate-semialdehyde dehydrogenase [uncultured Solirubrobacteraceae bacterium]|uniref:Aspartate-semialdehyde dehydrogenase n=1 Tax=uncultured Solirubrobacteraceae bacterium TaxID=1162706 RepID=A0A6J4TAA8_9ACTN|nr:MAG: Aspartate-semialdehyde dehydrogenase [uncultured Solirubrobacteraceae bacterium]